ncbi:cupin domain-containing protein [Pseudonocardia acaciae]|uniref:cupin domain-containing protein n=1 Tax=Pseudonocardia acaciae TaxID=551276 RepID=UPI0007E8CA9B|nr:cupin domain-containing protein [Pseudonocardia acaciae]
MTSGAQVTSALRRPTVVAADGGRRVASVGNIYRYLAIGEQTNDTYALFEVTLPVGEGAPMHVHSREEEAFFILEGEVAFYSESSCTRATPGMFLNFPVGVERGFRNETDGAARMLVLVAPAGLEGMMLEDGVELEGPDDVPPPIATEARECPLAAARYGITLVPGALPGA